MTSTFDINFPKIRNIDATPVTHRGQAFLMLRDPLHLQKDSILLPMDLAPLLAMCDGTKGIGELSIALEVIYGLVFTTAEIEDIIGAFDKHLLLETAEIANAEGEALRKFREAEYRPAALAGLSYPSDPRELSESLDGYLANVEHHPQIPYQPDPLEPRGVVPMLLKPEPDGLPDGGLLHHPLLVREGLRLQYHDVAHDVADLLLADV